VWSNIDVKGFARSAIPALLRAGISALYIGGNGHTSPAHTPPIRGLQPVVGVANATAFRWMDSANNVSIPVLYHDGYGGYTHPSEAIVTTTGVGMMSYFRSDNSGPPLTLREADLVYSTVQGHFPHAEVLASSFDAFAAEVRCAFSDRNVHSRMPLVPTPARFKRAGVCPMGFRSGVHSSYRLTL
jgi:hypothetical protein